LRRPSPPRLHQAYRRTFDSPEGELVLADLERRGFGLTPHFDPDPQRTAYNEGRRSLLLHILAMIEEDPAALNPTPNQEDIR
jgi:hypothetical protein